MNQTDQEIIEGSLAHILDYVQRIERKNELKNYPLAIGSDLDEVQKELEYLAETYDFRIEGLE